MRLGLAGLALVASIVGAQEKDRLAEYRLGPGDSIRISVFQNPDMTLETRVGEDGAIYVTDAGMAQRVRRISPDGHVVTNHHVVDVDSYPTVIDRHGRQLADRNHSDRNRLGKIECTTRQPRQPEDKEAKDNKMQKSGEQRCSFHFFSGVVFGNSARRATLVNPAALKKNGVEYTMHTYENTNHGFHNNSTPRYDEAAAKLSWERTIAFFKKNLA
jgi:hypothetical protein